MSSFFKSSGGLLLIRACYSAKRKEHFSLDSCAHPSTAVVLELLQLLLSWDLPDTANPVLFRLRGVLAAGGGELGAA